MGPAELVDREFGYIVGRADGRSGGRADGRAGGRSDGRSAHLGSIQAHLGSPKSPQSPPDFPKGPQSQIHQKTSKYYYIRLLRTGQKRFLSQILYGFLTLQMPFVFFRRSICQSRELKKVSELSHFLEFSLGEYSATFSLRK